MSAIDWAVLALTLFLIVAYGIWKSRHHHNLESFFLANKQLPWYHVCLSVMATQASAITFLSLPGLAYSDGMRFVQFYFGLPIAMIVLCITFIPVFHRLKVYTAYEFLEKRFDHRTRALTSLLFLLSRGLATGISIYAPAIILSSILDLNINVTTCMIGLLVIIYTVYGGTRAVSYTQLLQMSIILMSLAAAGFVVAALLPSHSGWGSAMQLAGKMGKMNLIDWKLDFSNRYNIWSGIIGGFFLQLAYFGTDQSQVGRYLTGSSVTQSRMGLLMNGLVKIPMQFFILLIGILVFAFYQFNPSPIFFNKNEIKAIHNSIYEAEFKSLEKQYAEINEVKNIKALDLSRMIQSGNEPEVDKMKDELLKINSKANEIRNESIALMKKNKKTADVNDTNYVFLHFVTSHMPVGFIGLMVAVIFLASMGSLAAGLNSLASATAVDFYIRSFNKTGTDKKYLAVSRFATVAWGIFCIVSALYAGKKGNLIEVVNIIGSLFYGTILGIFLVAFYFKKIKAAEVFYAAIISELIIAALWWYDVTAFLWLNVIGCLLVILISQIMRILKVRTK
ncbi:MAG: sodium:solute symporter [Bacteroidia bacterium]